MGRSRFPGKPLKFHNRKRVSVLSGAVYHDAAAENSSSGGAETAADFTGDKEEEEKKENNQSSTCPSAENTIFNVVQGETVEFSDKNNSDASKSPVRTRSQNRMDSPKADKPKPVKKTVTFGTVESCDDIDYLPLKKLPKHHAPLVPIIKKKSSLKYTEYSTFSSILKPAKLTDLSSKSSSDHYEGYLRKHLNPLSKPINKFAQISESRCHSPPPRNTSPVDKETCNPTKFVLPGRSSHSLRVIKPNKRFIDGEEHTVTSSISSGKVLKRPKLKKVVFNNIPNDDDDAQERDKDNDNEKSKDKRAMSSSSLFKDKTTNAFTSLGSRKPLVDVFSFDKSNEYSQDENSNLEEPDKANGVEEKGHALRKLMDISDASTSASSSGSESEESWESDSHTGSEGEEKAPSPSPEKEKVGVSQLQTGKVIIREARLQLNTPSQSTSGLDGPFSTLSSATTNNPPTTVTCGVCGAVRFYRFVKQARKFGIYSCESCRKFISKMLKKEKLSHRTGPIIMQCLQGEGNCHVPPIVRSQQWKLLRCSNKARCPACWLKMCLRAFQVPPNIRTGLTAMLPQYMRASIATTGPSAQANPLRPVGQSTGQANTISTKENENNIFVPLKTTNKTSEDVDMEEEDAQKDRHDAEEENDDLVANKKRRLTRVKVKKKDADPVVIEDPKRQKVELKGPRVKHVCRSASIVLGQPIATFPTQEEKGKEKPIPLAEDISSLPVLDKQVAKHVSSAESETDTENKWPSVTADEPPAKDLEPVIPKEPKKRKAEALVPLKVQNKSESSEDETIFDLVPRKNVLKTLSNITNVRGRPQKCDQNRPELICVDFWESYDPDEVCSSGFGLIGTASFTVARLCFLCGSAGREKMLVCSSCCEWYHSWCAEDAVGGAGWTCARCVSCAACARPAARLRCRGCTRHYHAACLPAAPPDHRSDWPQICSACLKCKSCDSTRVSKFVGSLPFCGPCFKLRQKGNYCPLCQACYRDNDFDSKMMECGWCGRWVHASCEGLTGEGYQLLSALPPSIEYICCKCMPHDPPWRKMLTEHLKGRLLHLLKLLAKNKKACALLKLTPHKNTPDPNKSYQLMSPQAIRKLHFDNIEESMKNTTETKVYRNTARGRRSNQAASKSDDASSLPTWHCSSFLSDIDMDKEDMPHASHKVVNLQEPLMQNKEICFSTGLYGIKTEFDAPCIEVHETYSTQCKSEKATTMLPTTIHDDKYEAISDDDEPAKAADLLTSSQQDPSPALVSPVTTADEDSSRVVSPSLLDIKKRVNSDEYVSLKDFNHDMKEVIERTCSIDLKQVYKEIFSETFPWFDCENDCLQPNLEVEGGNEELESLKIHEASDNNRINTAAQSSDHRIDQIVPKLECEGQKYEEDLLEFYPVPDSRTCLLCKTVGDGLPCMEGRLLYCGQNDWIHANCALWSAEVFEEIDGSLQNVHSAISRGKMIKCASCEVKGASVGCCAKNCSETYHYACARNQLCAFLDDKRVFCPPHGKDIPLKSLQRDADFELARPVYVELDKKKKRYSEIEKVQFLLGSLSVHSLGKIVPSVSDYEEFLMPVDFSCTRLFWSSKKPSKIVKYTIKTKLILSEPMPGFDHGVNITVDHSMDFHTVEKFMSEIGSWHDSLQSGSGKSELQTKVDQSPIKVANTANLEDLVVKQVVEYLLDNVCKQEQQQDEEEPQNTADLLPPELKDAIFEDLNHDLLDGISMQDIFPNPYDDLVSMDLKGEFYSAISQNDDKSNDKPDFIDELLNSRLETSGGKEIKRTKSDVLLQSHTLKTFSTGRGQQRSSSLTWTNRFDPTLLSSTIKRCKMSRTSTVTGKLSPVQRLLDSPIDTSKEVDEKKTALDVSLICDESQESPHTSGLNYRTTSPKEKDDSSTEKSDKTENYYTDVIDFYTKIQCSPISQLDGAADWSGSDSSGSRPNSPCNESEFMPIQQLDGAEETHGNPDSGRNQTNQFVYRASGSESTYTVTIAGNSISGQPELVMRPLDEISGTSGQIEHPVRCDRCQCTYRNKESYDRHIPSCDMMSTSESESENPKSPENRTLTTLQNAFQGAFAQPMLIHAGVVSGSDSTVNTEAISARRSSINTRQITINGTIVETPSPDPTNEVTMTITEQMKSGTVIFDQNKSTNVQVSGSQQFSPQIVVTPQLFMPPKTSTASGQKIITPHIITQPGILPYNICVKPGSGNTVQQIQGGTDMAQLLSGPGGIQVLASNSNQMLTLPTNHAGNLTPIIHGKNQVTNFPNLSSATSIALPVNSIQGMPSASIIQNIQPMMRSQIQGNPTIVMPAMTAQRLSSPNSQNKQQILISGSSQKSPKKQTAQFQPKPIFQATSRGRGRPIPKPTNTIKRQTKLEKTFTTINQSALGTGNTVIQLQTNNQTGQPSIIVQPVTNQNLMTAYVEALSQQNQNMQYIATLAPQGDFKSGPTQFISQGGLMPQTFQIQQTENGLVAVPSGGIPVLLPQGNVGILPQSIQQGTIMPQGTIQQGILSQGPNGPTILPQAIHTQNGTTIIPQGTIQGLTPNNTLQTAGATQSGIGNGQTTMIPNSALQSQGNTIISSGTGTTILPQGTILPQFCNDQVILGSTPTLEMVTDSSGCMYLTATQPVYYGLETIVQNTVMSSQQFVSTAMQGVLAQNSSFSATTTQVFQASKIEPIVEVPTGYVVVNNMGENVTAQTSTPNVITAQSMQSSPQSTKTGKTAIPNLTLQPLPAKSPNNNVHRATPKVQMNPPPVPVAVGSQPSSCTMTQGRPGLNPITSQVHNMTISNTSQNLQRSNMSKANIVSMAPSVNLVSSMGQPMMAISQSFSSSIPTFTLQSIPMSQSIVSSAIAPPASKPSTIKSGNVIEISSNRQGNSSSTSMPTISVTQSIKSPIPWRQMHLPSSNSNCETKVDPQSTKPGSFITPSINMQGHLTMRPHLHNEADKNIQNQVSVSNSNSQVPGVGSHSHQFESSNGNHHSSVHSNNVIQITAGNIYSPSSVMNSNFDADTTLKLSKINALSKTEGGHMNFVQEIMGSHSQHNDKSFQNMGANENKHETITNQIHLHKLSSCQVAGTMGSTSAVSSISHSSIRPQNPIALSNTNNQLCSIGNNSQMQMLNSGANPLQNVNMTCQEISNNRVNITVSNNSMQNQHHDVTSSSMSSMHMQHGNIQHDNHLHTNPNQIHVMSGQIPHTRQSDNNGQLQQINQSTSNRAFHHDSLVGGQQTHSQPNILTARNTPTDNSNVINIHGLGNNHNLNRDLSDISHANTPMNSMSNLQNNRMLLDNMQSQVNNMGHQIHATRSMDNIHSGPSHNMQPIHHHHMNSSLRSQVNNTMQHTQQLNMQQNRQMDNSAHHHQHQMSNLMQGSHGENNLMGLHQQVNSQMHNRTQIDTMHLHHMTSTAMENSSSMSANTMHGNRHENHSLNMQSALQNNRGTMESHSPHMQHQMNSASMHSSMLMTNNHQNMNSSLMHMPDIKSDIQNSCSGSCSNTNAQFTGNQNSFESCANMNASSLNMNTDSMIHSLSMNNTNMLNTNIYGSNNQTSMTSHDMLMSYGNTSDQNILSGRSNHMMTANALPHSNANQIMGGSVSNATQININSCSMNSNTTSINETTNIDNQINRNNVSANESTKFNHEQLRNKDAMGPTSNASLTIGNIQNNDCAKVNEKQNHVTVNSQIGFVQMNAQNNRSINLPERSRINSTNIENIITQHVPQQHNIRVTNNISSNVSDALAFQHKAEASSTMINVPFQTIPNTAPMNINVNSSNNTVNITVQNNLVDPKTASKTTAEISFPIQSGNNSLQNQPVKTKSLPTQNTSSISLPKAPPTQQSGIPTNVVNPMSMRPMNRVLPLHRDSQTKSIKPPTVTAKSTAAPTARPRPVAQDMPDLNIKDDMETDLEKAIVESKRIIELDRTKRDKEERSAVIGMPTEIHSPNTSNALASVADVQTEHTSLITAKMPTLPSLPSLDADIIDMEPPKLLMEKDEDLTTIQCKTSPVHSKVTKRPLADKKNDYDSVATKKSSKPAKGQENKPVLPKQPPETPKDDSPKLIYEVTSEDGFKYTCSSLTDLWAKVLEVVQNARKQSGLPQIQYNVPYTLNGANLLGMNNNALRYLIEQLPGASRCTKYKTRQGRPLSSWDNDLDLSEGFKESPWGSARTGPIARKPNHDMFSWMASPFRDEPPPCSGQESDSSISRRLATLPAAMRFRHLKETSKACVGVYRSHIHGRGLFCKRDIEEGDMVIEYAGEVIRAVLADQREKKYEAMGGRRGVGGCYMFRIDDNLVVDATLKGNAARFINHSCDPNCYSRVVDIHGHKHILIFALRRITIGEELTYDYKFPFEDVKIPCTCGAKKCRKYLN